MKKYLALSLIVLLLSAGCSSDSETSTHSQPLESKVTYDVESAVGPTVGIYGFDLFDDHATATILGLGYDVRIAFDGSFKFEHTIDSNGQRPDWAYSVGTPQVRRGKDTHSLRPIRLVEQADHELTLKSRTHAIRFEHRPDGLKHSIDLFSKPEGSGLLTVRLPGSGVSLREGKRGVEVRRDQNYDFAWTDLAVLDATGQDISAQMRPDGSDLVIEIDDTEAIYPLTVDPLAGSRRFTLNGAQDGSRFGLALGKVLYNDDMIPDLVVGQQLYESTTDGSESNEGRALIYQGVSGGNPSSTAVWSYESNVAGAVAGAQVGGIGDVNGDGNEDLVITAPRISSPGGDVLAGGAFIFHGTPTGLASSPSTELYGTGAVQFLGLTARGVGDVNCDGFDDFATGSTVVNTSDGRAWVFLGSASGVATTAAWTFDGTADEQVGAALASANFNGDTNLVNGNTIECNDLVVAAPSYDDATLGANTGRVFVFNGSTSGLPANPSLTIVGDQSATFFGTSIDTGDFNADGNPDLVIGEPRRDTGGGVTDDGGFAVFEGSASGLTAGTPDYETDAGSQFGGALVGNTAAAGDVNNDGFDDVILGGPEASVPEVDEGVVIVELGSSNGMSGARALEETSDVAGARRGDAVAFLGDIDNDGIGDFAVGEPRWASGAAIVGRVTIVYGALSCEIGGGFYADSEENPNNTCEFCDVAQSRTAWTSRADNTICDDGDLCTQVDTCQSGVCTGSQPKQCNDGNQCTVDLCDPLTGQCTFDGPAADGNSCTIPNQPTCQTNECDSGTCLATAVSGCLINGVCYNSGDLNPNNSCGICDPTNDQSDWTNAPATTSCDDGLFCTVNDTCDGAGVCQSGGARDCSGAASECFDSVVCSEPLDRCQPSSPSAAGTMCGGNLCTVGGMCDGSGNCSGMTKDCSNLDTECMVGVCDLSDGSCVGQPIADGTPCSDGDACTESTTCQSGICGDGAPITCDDMNSCTSDSCDSMTGCVFDAAPNEGDACNDGDACTENDTCSTGVCTGDTLMCDDGNSCTADSCDSTNGCEFTDEADGTMCIGDALSCTTDACNAGTCESTLDAGSCVIDDTCFAAGVENPDNTCEVCDPSQATDAFSPKTDGEACGLGQCNAEGTAVVTGTCSMGACAPAGADMDRDCAPYVCTSGACLDSCVEDDDCQDGFVCDEDNACTEPVLECTGDEDCDEGEVCVNDLCVAETCENDEDCPGDLVCGDDGACTDPVVDECQTDDDCGAGEVCNDDNVCEDDGTVDPGTCTDDSDCGADARCENAVCVKGAVEGGGCGCAAADAGPTDDASWMLLAAFGLFGLLRRRR